MPSSRGTKPLWKRLEVILAVITAVGVLGAAAISVAPEILKKDPPSQPPQAPVVVNNTVTVTVPPIEPPKPATPPRGDLPRPKKPPVTADLAGYRAYVTARIDFIEYLASASQNAEARKRIADLKKEITQAIDSGHLPAAHEKLNELNKFLRELGISEYATVPTEKTTDPTFKKLENAIKVTTVS